MLKLSLALAHTTTPFISVYPWNGGFWTKNSNPSTLPAGDCFNTAWSPNGAYVAVTTTTSPYIAVYPWTGQFGAKFADPQVLPAVPGDVAWSPKGDFIAVTHTVSNYIHVYPWNSSGFGAPVADPATPPVGNAIGVAWHPAGTYIAVAHDNSPFVSAYAWTGTGFGAKVADPSTLPTGTGNCVAWSPDGAYLAVGHATSPNISVYPFSNGVFGAKLANPSTLPGNTCVGVTWSPVGNFIGVAIIDVPQVAVYPWSAGFGAKVADPSTLPASTGRGLAWSPAQDYIAVAHDSTPFISVYPWNGTFGSKLANPGVLPAGNGKDVSWLNVPQVSRTKTLFNPFNPKSISGLISWHDATVQSSLWQNSGRTTPVTANSDPVGAWDDLSGNGYHLVQSTSGSRPLYKTGMLNNLPVIRGDGTDDFLTNASYINGTTWSIFVVCRRLANNVNCRFLCISLNASPGGNTSINLFNDTTGVFGYYGDSGAGAPLFSPGNDTIFSLAELFLTSGGAGNGYYNGQLALTFTMPTLATLAFLTLFGDASAFAADNLNADIGEVIIYNSVLSAANRIKVEKYLMNKWSPFTFTPNLIPGLAAWYDATRLNSLYQNSARTTAVAVDGDLVGAWSDLSGNGNHITQSVGINRPTYKTAIQNGNAIVRFTFANGTFLAKTYGALLSQPNTIFWAGSFGSHINTFIYDGVDVNNRNVLTHGPSGSAVNFGIYAGSSLEAAHAIPITASVWTAVFNGASSQVWQDGTSFVSGNAAVQPMGGLTMGAAYTGGANADDDTFELIIYNRLLSTDERQQVERYLKLKWGTP